MKLGNVERLILLMLSDIYEKLDIQGEVDPKFIRRAILSNNLWGLHWQYEGLFDEEPTPKVVTEVCDILNMWRIIEWAYAKLTPAEKVTLEKDVAPFGKDPRFEGFDGNNESEYMSVARFLIEELARYAEFKKRDLNSHAPVVNRYLRMVAAFKPISSKLEGWELTVAELTEILKAR